MKATATCALKIDAPPPSSDTVPGLPQRRCDWALHTPHNGDKTTHSCVIEPSMIGRVLSLSTRWQGRKHAGHTAPSLAHCSLWKKQRTVEGQLSTLSIQD